MLDPILHHLPQAKQSALLFAQLMQLDPDLVMPAALPLIAARLMGASWIEDDGDEEIGPAEVVV